MRFPATRTVARWALFMSLLAATGRPALGDPPQVGITERVPWTTSQIKGSPDPPLPYVTERLFPQLKFTRCLDITAAPGSDRLYVVEQGGKIYSFPNRADVAQADLVVDVAEAIPDVRHVYALAFHPNFAQNRHCFICYIKAANLDDGTHVARFTMADTHPPTIDVASETTLVTWRSGGHNGCSLKFGPDGFLYISTGDAAPANPPDTMKTGQDVSDLLSSILRIDVDHAENGNNYRIPTDNPFVDLPGARGEVWAYGLRNPWRMSFDAQTGDLWVGDVGWERWEMLYRIERGGNYGWAVREGRQSTHPEWPRGPTPILPPTIDHRHTESSSITDGLTYYGKQLPELYGTHIYGDYDTGKLWGFRYADGKVVDHRELADTTHRIVGFGATPDQELVLLDHTAGTMHRLVPNPRQSQTNTFPRTLSESGLFASTRDQIPAPGVVPYSIVAEPWADHATAQRWVAVPNALSVKPGDAAWTFPPGSVLVKTLALNTEPTDTATARRIETQILHFEDGEWMPYTYQWNDDQSDAVLVEATGTERTFEIADESAPWGRRQQTWRFAGRAECQRCHNKWSGPVLGFRTPQLRRDHNYGEVTASQLETFAHIRLVDPPLGKQQPPIELVSPTNVSADLNDRARGYLQANCAHCHRLHAGGAVLSHMHFDLPLEKTNMVGTRPTQGTFGIHAAQVVAPGDPFRSVLLYRMAKLGSGRMPHIGSTEVDRNGLELIHQWLDQLPPNPDQETPGDAAAAKLRDAEADLLERLLEAESTAQTDLVDQLLRSTSGGLRLMWAVDHDRLPPPLNELVIQRGARHDQVSIRDLFERFLPPGQRVQRLGNAVKPEQILSHEGDPVRGKQVFFQTAGVACKNCHRIDQQGKQLGPDLTAIGKKLTRPQLLESILEPSQRIDPQYVVYLAETDDGRIHTGLLVSRTQDEVVLRDAQDKLTRLPASTIEQLVPQRQSLMPDLQVRDLTAQQVADLLAYLSSLK